MSFFGGIGNFFGGLFRSQKTDLGVIHRHRALPQASYGSNRTYGTNSGGEKWGRGLSSTGYSPTLDHRMIRANARSAYHDSLQARALVDRMTDTVIDVGLRLESMPNAEILGITREQAEEWSEKTEGLFHIWAKSKKSVQDRSMNFYQAQALIETAQQRDNDYFVRFNYNNEPDLFNPLQLSFIDPDQIMGAAFTATSGGITSFDGDGIERDGKGREVAYNIQVKVDGRYKYVRLPARTPDGLEQVVHGYKPDYVGQNRGYSRLGMALEEFEKITDFTSAQIMKAINQSNLVMSVKPGKDAPASNPFETVLGQEMAGPLPSDYIGGDPTNPAAAAVPIQDYEVKYVDLPEATLSSPGSVGVFNLNSGEGLEAFQNTAPSESFDSFVNAFTSYCSSAYGMPIEVLLMKFGQNYSASRATLILFWRIALMWREEISVDFLNPTYGAWLTGEIAAGRIQAPGWQDPLLREAWCGCMWLGMPMPNIDPQRTMEADKGYVELGATTLDKVARDNNGSSGKKNRAKLAREFEELPPAPWGKAATTPENPDTEEEEEEEEE